MTSVLVAGTKLLDFIDKLKQEKYQIQETLNERTISYYENLTYYQDELGQTIQESEICETKQRILKSNHNKRAKKDSQIISDYEYTADSLHTKLEYSVNNVPDITLRQTGNISNPSSTKISPQQIEAVKTLKNEPVLSSTSRKKGFLKRLFRKK